MKICSPQLGISPYSKLGGEIYDAQTLKGFTKKGFKVFVYLPKNRNYDKSLKNFYVSYSAVKHIVPPWLYSIICLPYLYKTYKREKFDILRIHSPRFLGIAGIIFHFFYPNLPILASAVTVDDSKAFFLVEKALFKISKKIIVQSGYMKKRLVKRFNIAPKKIEITYGGALESEKKWTHIPNEAQKLSPLDPVMLFMGMLVARKNPLFLVELFSKSKVKVNNLKLVIIGTGPLKKMMQKQLQAKGLLADTIFVSEAFAQDKNYWFARMDLFVFPSLDEGFGLAVTEAMSFAKPVITSNKAAFEEIITSGKDGYALPLSDTDAWEQTVTGLIKNREMCTKIGNEAKKTVERQFTWGKTYDLNAKVIREMTK
jgi:glycosyltransferase involved in cell wall biosynthesis